MNVDWLTEAAGDAVPVPSVPTAGEFLCDTVGRPGKSDVTGDEDWQLRPAAEGGAVFTL